MKTVFPIAIALLIGFAISGCIEDPETPINATTTTAPSDSSCTQSKSGAFQVCDESSKVEAITAESQEAWR
jgi:hypothetical protein